MIDSYAKAVAEFNRARSKAAGRPLNHHLRLLACDEGIRMDYDAYPLCVFTPDNKLTFVMSQDRMQQVAHSLTQFIHRHTPVSLARLRAGVYNMWMPPGKTWRYIEYRAAPKCIYHEGLQFDLDRREFLNPKADPKDRVNSDARRVWLEHLRKFRTQVLLRQKLGIFDTIIAGLPKTYYRVSEEQAFAVLHEALHSDPVTVAQLDVLTRYIMTVNYWYGGTPDSKVVAMQIVSLCTQKFNYKLRQKFNVFEEA